MRIHLLKITSLALLLFAATAGAQELPVAAQPGAVAPLLDQQPPPALPTPRGQGVSGQGVAPQPPPPPGQPPGPGGRVTAALPPARLQGQPINVRIELTITDQTGTAPAAKKTVLMTVADEERGSIRSTAQITRGGPVTNVPLSVDATPTVIPDNRVRLRLSLEYDVAGNLAGTMGAVIGGVVMPAGAGAPPGGASAVDERWSSQVRQSLGVVLTSGVPLVVAQSADPHSDRRVSLEVKATILK